MLSLGQFGNFLKKNPKKWKPGRKSVKFFQDWDVEKVEGLFLKNVVAARQITWGPYLV